MLKIANNLETNGLGMGESAEVASQMPYRRLFAVGLTTAAAVAVATKAVELAGNAIAKDKKDERVSHEFKLPTGKSVLLSCDVSTMEEMIVKQTKEVTRAKAAKTTRVENEKKEKENAKATKKKDDEKAKADKAAKKKADADAKAEKKKADEDAKNPEKKPGEGDQAAV